MTAGPKIFDNGDKWRQMATNGDKCHRVSNILGAKVISVTSYINRNATKSQKDKNGVILAAVPGSVGMRMRSVIESLSFGLSVFLSAVLGSRRAIANLIAVIDYCSNYW